MSTLGWYPPADEAGRLDFPATGRNRDALWSVLERWLPRGRAGAVLEIASGSGQHVVHFAEQAAADPERAQLRFVPSDPDPAHRRSIAAWVAHADADTMADRVAPPIDLDVTADGWGADFQRRHAELGPIDAVFCANMIHIAPWSACEGLVAGCGRVLAADPPGTLILYGPFMRGGVHTSPSNEAFSARLRARNPAWGVRDLDDVVRLANTAGLVLDDVVEMPANNLSVRFSRR